MGAGAERGLCPVRPVQQAEAAAGAGQRDRQSWVPLPRVPGSDLQQVRPDSRVSHALDADCRAVECGAGRAGMTPLYIFDLDGTLALIDHRRHFLDDKADPKRWQKFFAACVDDQPNEPVIRTLQALRRSGAECWIWSGRSDEVRSQTVEWLCRHGCFGNRAIRCRGGRLERRNAFVCAGLATSLRTKC